MNLSRRTLLELMSRGGLALGGGCLLSRFALLDALAADAADENPFQVATVDYKAEPGRKLSRLGFGMMRLPCKVLDYLKKEREAGRIKHLGFSFPGVFGLINTCRTEGLLGPTGDGTGVSAEARQKFLALYNGAFTRKTNAARCTSCRRCLSKCPQHINICGEMKKVSEMVAGFRD